MWPFKKKKTPEIKIEETLPAPPSQEKEVKKEVREEPVQQYSLFTIGSIDGMRKCFFRIPQPFSNNDAEDMADILFMLDKAHYNTVAKALMEFGENNNQQDEVQMILKKLLNLISLENKVDLLPVIRPSEVFKLPALASLGQHHGDD